MIEIQKTLRERLASLDSLLPRRSALNSEKGRRIGLGLLVVFAIYAISLWAAVSSTLDLVRDFQMSDIASADSTIDGSITLAIDKLDSLTESTAKTKRVAVPFLAMCWVGRVVPPVRDNCDAVAGLFDRFAADSEAGLSLLNAVRSMDRLVGSFQGANSDSDEIDWPASILDLRRDLDEFELSLATASAIDVPSGGRVLPQLVSTYERADSAEQELVELARFTDAGVQVLESAANLQQSAQASFDDLARFGGSLANFGEARSTFVILDPLARDFRTNVEEFVSSMPRYLDGSSIQLRIETISGDAEVIADLILGISEPIEILDRSFEKLRSTDRSLLESGGFSMILQDLIAENKSLVNASANLLEAYVQLSEGSRLQRLLGSDIAAKLEELLGRYSGLIETLADAPVVLNSLLGAEGQKRYLVLGQSSDEIRPAGGFTSSVWVITVEQGRLVDVEYTDVLAFGEREVLDQIPIVPNELRIHMDARAWYLRDVGWSPDFRSVAETALLMNSATGHVPVDGVISLTQWGFVYLVEGLGFIDTPEGRLSGSEVMADIERGTDLEGAGYSLTLFNSMIESLTIDNLEESFVGFGRSLLRSFDEKQIMIYATDPDLQSKIEKLGWSGSVTVPTGDMLGVFDSNVGWNKVGRNIDRSVAYRVDLNTAGGGTSKVSITYRNDSESVSPDCGEQSEPPPRGNYYGILKHGCFWDYLRVYTPLGSEVLSLSKLPAPELSVAVRTGWLVAGSDTAGVYFDEVGQYLGGLLVVQPDSLSTLEFEYELQKGVTQISGDEIVYTLSVLVQSGVPGSMLDVQVAFPDGYRVIESNIKTDSADQSVFQLNGTLDSDIELRVVATKRE